MNDDDPFSSFQRRSSIASPVHVSLLQKAIDGVMSLALCPQVVSQHISSSSTRQIFRDASHLWWLLCPQVCLLGDVPLTLACQDITPKTVFERRRILSHASLGFESHSTFHVLPFNCISFQTFSRQLSVFSLCSSGLVSALLVLSTIHLFMKVAFNPDIIPSG